MIHIALPKGRLGEQVYACFARAGYPCPDLEQKSRKLIFEHQSLGLRYFWVKPADVPIYVERGTADIGVAGKDILLESRPDVYELLDLGLGKCRLALAACRDFYEQPEKTLRVATKFPHISKQYFRARGRDIDIIRLNGSIELAPLLGLSDVIVDIVETGATLRANQLKVLEYILPVSARLIANKGAFAFKHSDILQLTESLKRQIGERRERPDDQTI